MLRICLSATSVCVFGAFAWAVRSHFSRMRLPAGMLRLSLFTTSIFVFFLYLIWTHFLHFRWAISGALVQIFSFGVFVAAVRESTVRRLAIAFEVASATFILRSGVYSRVRHPFYLSYMLFWIGCGVELRTMYFWPLVAALTLTYYLMARNEELLIEQSAFAAEYAEYKRVTGMFAPILRLKFWSQKSSHS